MAKWNAEARRKLPAKDMGKPSDDGFPIKTQEDLDNAARDLGRTPNPEAVKRRLISIAKRLKLTLPKSWQEKAAMAAFDDEAVVFDMGDGDSEGEEVVYSNALLFRCGDYPDKEFSLSAEEAAKAIESFEPVRNELQHINSQFGEATILDGKLGEVRDVWVEGEEVRGEVAIPKWLDRIWQGTKQVSAVWDRATKTISGLGLVIKGRVPDAALMAAFAATHPEDADALFGSAQSTPHGRGALQTIHDHAAMSGAVCSAVNSGSSGPPGFTAPRERNAIQKIHDMATSHGARCSITSGRSALMSNGPKEGKRMATLVDKFKALFGANLPEETEDDQIEELLTGLKAEFAAKPKMTVPADDEDEEDEEDDEKPAPKKGKGKAAMAAEPTAADRAAEREMKRLREEVEALREENLQTLSKSAAVAFADSVKDRILPTERENLITIYTQAVLDDQRSKTTVTFSDVAGKAKTGSREDALKSVYARRPPITSLFNEYVSADQIPDGSVVLFNRTEAAERNKREVGFSDDEKGQKRLDAELKKYGHLGDLAVKERRNGSG